MIVVNVGYGQTTGELCANIGGCHITLVDENGVVDILDVEIGECNI